LINKLYVAVSRKEEGNASDFTISMDWEHSIFKGHFPENPVLPGVCTIQIIGELLAEILDNDVRLEKASAVKYPAFISPAHGREFNFSIRHSLKEDGSVACSANVYKGNITFCTFKGEFRKV